MSRRSIIFPIVSLLLLFGCNGEDVTGTVAIEYSGDWYAEISLNREKSIVSGSGDWERSYENPDMLSATVTKLDTTERKLILYIYEDERIVEGDSTREPEGTVFAEYEYPF
jgi:hypothetical protein